MGLLEVLDLAELGGTISMDLLSTGAPPVQGPSLDQLAALHRRAADLRQILPARDPEAEGTEWDEVASIVTQITDTLRPTELTDNDLQTATALVQTLPAAIGRAKQAIQTRLTAAAQQVRERAAKDGAPDPDAVDNEWAPVIAACEAVDKALPKAALKKADIVKAGLEADKIKGVADTVRTAIQVRLGSEARLITDQLPPLAKPDPEARGEEWTPVIAACKEVETALTKPVLHKDDIAAGQQKLVLAGTAAKDALAAIQLRLQAEKTRIHDEAEALRALPPQASETERKRVGEVCDKTQAALPATSPLTEAALEPAAKLLRTIPAVVKSATDGIQARLKKAAAVQLEKLKPYEITPPGREKEWEPVATACSLIRVDLTRRVLSQTDLDNAEAHFNTMVGTTLAPVLAEAWKADIFAAKEAAAQASGRMKMSRMNALVNFLTPDKTRLAFADKLKQPAPTDLAAYTSAAAELRARTEAMCAQVSALKDAVEHPDLGDSPEPDVLKAALEKTNYRQVAAFRDKQQRDKGALELIALNAAKDKAEKALVALAGIAAAEKDLKAAISKLALLATSLDGDLKRSWDKASFVDALKGPVFTAENLDSATFTMDKRDEGLASTAKERKAQETVVANVLGTYADGKAPPLLDQLEALRDALAKNLKKGTAITIREKLKKTNLSLAAWTKMLDEARARQVNDVIDADTWAGRFGFTAGNGKAWVRNLTATVEGAAVHITLYPKQGAALTQTADQIRDTVVGTGTGGVHITQDRDGGKEETNPHVYRGGETRNWPTTVAVNQMTPLLANFVNGLSPIAQGFIDRKGLTISEENATKSYLDEVKVEIEAALTKLSS
jgi:hypothetical protein